MWLVLLCFVVLVIAVYIARRVPDHGCCNKPSGLTGSGARLLAVGYPDAVSGDFGSSRSQLLNLARRTAEYSGRLRLAAESRVDIERHDGQ
jgi:hypothetical protein